MAGRRNACRCWVSSGALLGVLSFNACLLSFDDYAEGDPCAASLDAGIHPSTAPDPVLRGCDAGAAKNDESDASNDNTGASDGASDGASGAGAAGMAGEL